VSWFGKSAVHNGLPNNSRFCFEGNVVSVNWIQEIGVTGRTEFISVRYKIFNNGLLCTNRFRFQDYVVRSVIGRAIAQAVSHWLPTARPGFDPRSVHVGFVVYKVALGHVFSEYFT
jgi:hypothetical protein